MEETSIRTLIIIPIRADRYKYQINEGKEHICNRESLNKMIYPITPDSEKLRLRGLLQRLRNIVYIVDEEKTFIHELHNTFNKKSKNKKILAELVSNKKTNLEKKKVDPLKASEEAVAKLFKKDFET